MPCTSQLPNGASRTHRSAWSISQQSYGNAIAGETIDEVSIYNKALTSTQISELYNQTAPTFTIGAEQVQSGVSTTLNSPIDTYNSTSSNITFNWTSIPNQVNLTNTTLYVWYSNNTLYNNYLTSLRGNLNVTTTQTETLQNGNYIWNAETCGDGVDCSFATNRTLSIDIPTLTRCGTLSQSITYTLQNNININGETCFKVDADNLILNGNGYSINGNNTLGTSGIYLVGSLSTNQNDIIENFNNISNFEDGLNLSSKVSSVSLINNRLKNNTINILDNSLSTNLNYLLYNNSFGQINWTNSSFLNNLTLKGDIGINNNISIGNNTAYVNVAPFVGEINSSADVYLYNLNYLSLGNPQVFQNNLVCKSCSNLTPLDGATIGFTVPFIGANYTIQEDLAKIDNNSYQNSTYETQLNKFQLNLTVPTGTTIYNSVFDYNGTNYTGAETYRNGDFYSLTQEIDAPTINSSQENVTLKWFFTYVDSFGNHYVQSTTEENQTIKEIFFGLCNSTYPVQTLDFTLKQETGTQSPITVGTNFQASFKYWLGSGKINKTYEINKLNQATSTFNFCIDPNLTFQTNMGAEYSASGFVSRRDYLNNVSLTNSTTKVNLYLLNESKAVKFFLSVLNGYAGLPDIFVTIDKYEIGSNNWIKIGRASCRERV